MNYVNRAMKFDWLKITPGLKAGVAVINNLDDTKFDQLFNRIFTKVKNQDAEIFTEEEILKLQTVLKVDKSNLSVALKTISSLSKKILRHVFMPADLKDDLIHLGITPNKAETIIKIWSDETKHVLESLPESGSDVNFSWKLNAEVSSDVCKKSKTPKVYLGMKSEKEYVELELEHPQLYSTYLQLEAIQHELDNLSGS